MKKETFYDKFKNINIDERELKRKYDTYVREQEELKMIDSGNLPLIDVVQFEYGEMAIHDGYHRLTAAWALGENKIKVNLVKL